MLSKRFESFKVNRRTSLYVPSETIWSTCSDTNLLSMGTSVHSNNKRHYLGFVLEIIGLCHLETHIS